jgi:hypothetical protein
VFCILPFFFHCLRPGGKKRAADDFFRPAAMGLYFMGAIVLFEKGERVLDSLAVSPAGAGMYALSKLCPLPSSPPRRGWRSDWRAALLSTGFSLQRASFCAPACFRPWG